MDAFDWLIAVVGSPLFLAAAVMTAVGVGAYAVLQAVRKHQRLVAFMQANGLHWSDTGSTMWLARVIERWDLCNICGELDGRWVDVRWRNRSGRFITVTANRDLTSGDSAGVVSLGAWTRPKPPTMLEGMPLAVSGRQLRVFVGGGEFIGYLPAAVAYTKALEAQPVTHTTE